MSTPLAEFLDTPLVHVKYVGNHNLHVVEGNKPTLLGRDWLSKIQMDWASIKLVGEGVKAIDQLMTKVWRYVPTAV